MLMEWLLKLGHFTWIKAEETNEFGFRVFGTNIWYYKWSDSPLVYRDKSEEPRWRPARKRELNLKGE